MHQSKAFTLAEVLIVLFLVGIFAMFANPSVIQNPKTELDKLNVATYNIKSPNNASIFNNLPKNKIPINEDAKIEINKIAEYKDIHDTPININIAEVSKKKIEPNYHLLHTYIQQEKKKNPIELPLEDIDKTETIYSFIKNPFNKQIEQKIGKSLFEILPMIDSKCNTNCFAKKYKTISGNKYNLNIDNSTPKGILNNGTRIAITNGTKNKKFPIIKIYIDLNGTRPPNTRCRDLFEYELYPTLKANQIFPAGKINNYTEIVYADTPTKIELPTGTFKQTKYNDKQIKDFIYHDGKYCEIKIEHDTKKNKNRSIIKY